MTMYTCWNSRCRTVYEDTIFKLKHGEVCFLKKSFIYSEFVFSLNQDGLEELVTPPELFTWTDRCACPTECNGEFRTKLTTGFRHEVVVCDRSKSTHDVQYKVTLTSEETGHTLSWLSHNWYEGMYT